MSEAWKTPARSLKSFGVNGLLADKCTVFYDSVFSTRHLGRISDLLSARLKRAGIDELRFRSILLLISFEAYRSLSQDNEPLNEPLVIEVGIDEEKIAVGVSFNVKNDNVVELGGLQERLTQGQGMSEFERILIQLKGSADGAYLRVQAGTKRFEVLALLSLSPRTEPGSVEVVEVDDSETTPDAGEYVELGDLNYPELLRDDSPSAKPPGKGAGEIIAQQAEGDATRTAVKSGAGKGDGSTLVKGSGDEDDGLVRIKGGSQEDEGGLKVISDVTQKIDSDGKTVVSGASEETEKAVAAYRNQIGQLQARIKELESELESQTPLVSDGVSTSGRSKGGVVTDITLRSPESDDDEENVDLISPSDEEEEEDFEDEGSDDDEYEEDEEGADGEDDDEDEEDEDEDEEDEDGQDLSEKLSEGLKGLRKKWPFGGGKKKKKRVVVRKIVSPVATAPGAEKSKIPVPAPGQLAVDGISAAEAAQLANVPDAEESAESLMKEITQGGMDEMISKFQKESSHVRKELKNPKSKDWLDNLMAGMIAEKNRLFEMARTMNASVRKREIEFKAKERALREEMRKKDEELRQKDTAMKLVKDNLAQVHKNFEQARNVARQAQAFAQYKKKFEHVQKLYDSTKSESVALNKRIEKLHAELTQTKIAAQQAAIKDGSEREDAKTIRGQYERTVKQLDEFKRTNTQLVDRIRQEEKKWEKSKQRIMEMKGRLEQAMSIAVGSRKDADQIKAQMGQLEVEKLRLDRELTAVRQELALMKRKASGGEGGASGGQSGPAKAS